TAAPPSALECQRSQVRVRISDQAGFVSSMAAEVGQVVAAAQTVMRLARADTLKVAIAIPEVRALGEAEVTLWADQQASYRGTLRELSAVADPVTRTYAARMSIRHPDARVLLGMTAKARFLRPAGNSRLSVPLTAIFQHDGRPALWVVDADQTVSLLQLATRLRLTVHDAAYLELAQRRGLPLATLDQDLRTAAAALGATLLGT
ncbi:efflux RND transporter periplasmic adaptor subunit, partial [Candidatus Accumulibacter aalborgensis]|uniref:efflux RND transporter periplasmic adaptor subunit n=1 Tax=Candidatus Accumulibacter aalborgensis TaxID=1860102 RepID=UPI000AAA9683